VRRGGIRPGGSAALHRGRRGHARPRQQGARVDRAGLASARLEGAGDPRLTLLGREELTVVRNALGLPPDSTLRDGLPYADLRRHLEDTLEPRERQALGLKHLGYSDKEMARLMGVKPNVPRHYLSEGKRKLRLLAALPHDDAPRAAGDQVIEAVRGPSIPQAAESHP
jgi:DNA-directed RNA polymerase specialized sigma24 family protein